MQMPTSAAGRGRRAPLEKQMLLQAFFRCHGRLAGAEAWLADRSEFLHDAGAAKSPVVLVPVRDRNQGIADILETIIAGLGDKPATTFEEGYTKERSLGRALATGGNTVGN